MGHFGIRHEKGGRDERSVLNVPPAGAKAAWWKRKHPNSNEEWETLWADSRDMLKGV